MQSGASNRDRILSSSLRDNANGVTLITRGNDRGRGGEVATGTRISRRFLSNAGLYIYLPSYKVAAREEVTFRRGKKERRGRKLDPG